MRESNFAFPAQNKACVCITSQLYDRRALDTTSPLPLFNSLTHLTYLTSTSPRIREIMTMDGGLERLVRLLHEFCICPPPPENPSLFYGLAPPTARPPKLVPTLNPPTFDKHAAYRFSLAFQCVVNIGVRGSEPIRSRVVQAGTLEVVGCILEAWLAHKGFAVGPNVQGAGGVGGNGYGWGGYGRETREQRHARRQQQRQMLRDVEEAAELARALQRQMNHTEIPAITNGHDSSIVEENEDTSADASTTTTPAGASTPTSGIDSTATEGADIVTSGRDRSGTVIARASWDPLSQVLSNAAASASQSEASDFDTARSSPSPSVSSNEHSRPSSRIQSETEDDADGDVDMDGPVPASASTSASTSDIDAPSPDRRPSRHRTHRPSMTRRSLVGLGLGGDQVPPMNMNMTMGGMNLAGLGDAHIIINDSIGGAEGLGAMGDVAVNMGIGGGMTGEDGIVSLDIETNDDFAMGAPPGAPGAIPAATMGDVTLGLDGDLSMSETEEGSRPASRGAGMDTDRQENHAMDRSGTIRRRHAPGTPDATPRAGVIGLPPSPVTSGSSGMVSSSRAMMPASGPPSPSLPSTSAMASSSTSQAGTIRANSGGSRVSVSNLNPAQSSRDSDSDLVPWHVVANAEAFRSDQASGLPEEELLARHRERRRTTEETVQRQQLLERGDTRRERGEMQQTNASSSGTNSRHHHRSTDDTQHTTEADRTTTSPNTLAPTATPGTTRSTASTISLASTTATASTSATSHALPPSPYRDEDVLLSLQLLAYLSKYPHVRQAFYKKRDSFHPASAIPPNGPGTSTSPSSTTTATAGPSKLGKERERDTGKTIKESSSGFFRAFANAASRGKEKERSTSSSKPVSSTSSPTTSTTTSPNNTPPRQTNVFSLVERFTYRPSSSEVAEYSASGHGVGIPPRLPPEIQYWAGVIMRNACRKDDSRGGIRQCANMLCGRWEAYPREFAKCRRCRKAKYCGKECQSTAWSEGHRFWCSAKDADDEAATAAAAVAAGADESSRSQLIPIVGEDPGRIPVPVAGTSTGTERRERRDRERHGDRRERVHGYAHEGHSRARGFDAVVGSGRQAPNNASGTTSRSGATEGYAFLPRDLQRQNQGQIVPSQGRGRPMMADPTMYAEYLRNSGHALDVNEGGRRRADTVTGAVTLGSSSTVRSDLTIPPYVPSANQRSHGQQRDGESTVIPRTDAFPRINPVRNDSAGSSTSVTSGGDNDMLLG